MEQLFIKVENNQPIDHPILTSNLSQALGIPDISADNVPENYMIFIRNARPQLGVYEVYEGFDYQIQNDQCVEVHHVRNMTDEEKLTKQNQVKSSWSQTGGFPSWTFNEETCMYDPPIPIPDDGRRYVWKEDTLAWEEFIVPDESLPSP